ncbi:MAG: hypothetical protein BWY17_04976 [Deltaproteobacteria bacterium ADurb.Bin207]|nr:MAG: hypothetical protein BWY17_04976 [Deltaproteobacteria bacterium ADurb.Bin207]
MPHLVADKPLGQRQAHRSGLGLGKGAGMVAGALTVRTMQQAFCGRVRVSRGSRPDAIVRSESRGHRSKPQSYTSFDERHGSSRSHCPSSRRRE